jgi:hypothetical protein
MKKEGEKPSGLELMISLVLTFFCIAVISFLSACVVGYYTSSIKNTLLVFGVGIVIASIFTSFRSWIMDRLL